ncbi:hypothetical protein F503_02730 [Ophiostoma piceae UAMH 11346]|uniref:Uncharacterized protein n=1 Tax=Ophiostoma piceae (strain UAMH 11346) TaxID=1262450 RepID=S3C1I7_OPHP1|nr:hypothetical protein F503_02730 [Ophiostoma piceae UAMH 11346]
MASTSPLKVCTALALLYLFGRTFVVAVLLFADGSNIVLYDCATYWLRRTLPTLDMLAEAYFVPVWGWVSVGASWCINYVNVDEITLASPLLDRTCSDIIVSHDELVSYYKNRAPPPPPQRLCPNGDHGNIEETLIIVREHFQKIMGAILTALFLSALLTFTLQTVSSLPSAMSRLPSKLAPISVMATRDRLQADFNADFNAIFGTPRNYYRRPPADPNALVVYKEVPPSPHFKADPNLNLAEARKAMREARAACIHQSAQAFVAAIRSRIEQDNYDADSGFTGGIHDDPDRDAEGAIGMSLFGLDDGSLIGDNQESPDNNVDDWL